MESIKSLARIQYGQGDTSNPYPEDSKEHEVFKDEVIKCQLEELRSKW